MSTEQEKDESKQFEGTDENEELALITRKFKRFMR